MRLTMLNPHPFFKKQYKAIVAISAAWVMFLAAAPPAQAQDVNQQVSITLKNQKLKVALDELQKQTHIVFLYSNMDQLDRLINVQYSRQPLRQVLDLLLQPVGLQYETEDGKILISKEQPKAPGRKTTEHGRVVDQEGKPLSGVSVKVKGSTALALTDADGRFTITSGNEKPILVFNYIGYTTQELAGIDNGELNVTMSLSANSLDEVVIIGYGKEKRRDLTGAISTIGGQELTQIKSASFLEGIEGRIAGLQVTSSSGEPGAAVSVNIRGVNSVNAATTPLYVIDGVQMEANSEEVATYSASANPLSSINPADIETVEVLKDASATAIYGSRGANGVIIITTKTGKTGSNLEFTTSMGVSNASKKLSLLNGQQYADYMFSRDSTSTDWGQTVNGVRQVKDFSKTPSYDWQDIVLRPAITQNANLFYSSVGPKTQFSSSLGYFNQQGILDKNNYERYSMNIKITHTVSNRFKIGTSINGSYGISNGVASSDGQSQNLFGVIQNLLMFRPIYLPGQDLSSVDPADLSVSNPLNFVNDSYRRTPFLKVIANTYGEYSFMKDLVFRSSLGGIVTSSDNGEFYPSTTSWGYPVDGLAILNKTNTTNWLFSNTLTYDKRLKSGHNFNGMLGFETNSYLFNSFDMRAEGFDLQSINGVDNINQAKVFAELPTTMKQKSNLLSMFGRLNYNYQGKYYATATLRRDGSSKFGDANKYAWFPSGALAWTVSNESFMKHVQPVSNLKLRASYGVTGNDRIPPYQSLANGTVVYYSNTNTVDPGIAITSIANPDLKWESTYQFDAGLDLGLFNDRVSVTADVYQKQTKNMLLNAPVASQSGFSQQWQNIGQVNNKGVELTIATTNIKTKNFSWSTSFNIAMNRNKVVSLGGSGTIPVTVSGQISNVGRVMEGKPLGTGYGYVFDGIYQNSDFVDPTASAPVLKNGVVSRNSVSVVPGDFKYKDLDGNGVINDSDMTVISNGNPKHFGGINNTFTYKNFSLVVFFQWSYGSQILNAGRYKYEGYQADNLSTDYWNNHWTPANPTNAYPRLQSNGRYDASTYYVEDGSYLRLKNITLSYNLPSSFTRKLGISNCGVYVTGENLITFDHYSGFDPEVASRTSLMPGLDQISYPRARTYTLGLNVKF